MTNQPNLTCAQHAEEILKRFPKHVLLQTYAECQNPVYALCVDIELYGHPNALDIGFWPDKEGFQSALLASLKTWPLKQLTIIKIAPGYPSLNIKVEVVE